LQGEAGGDAVYPHGLFADGGDAVAVQDCEDVGAGFGFLVDCDAVFEVVGYAVDGVEVLVGCVWWSYAILSLSFWAASCRLFWLEVLLLMLFVWYVGKCVLFATGSIFG
jgi:hypothetical protein